MVFARTHPPAGIRSSDFWGRDVTVQSCDICRQPQILRWLPCWLAHAALLPDACFSRLPFLADGSFCCWLPVSHDGAQGAMLLPQPQSVGPLAARFCRCRASSLLPRLDGLLRTPRCCRHPRGPQETAARTTGRPALAAAWPLAAAAWMGGRPAV